MDSNSPPPPSTPAQGTPFPVRGDRIPFFVGVSGAMRLHPDDLPTLRIRLRAIFEWLRASPGPDKPDFGTEMERIHADLAAAVAAGGPVTKATRDAWTGLGLGHTPIILLTAMAPGADQLVFEVAREMDIAVEVPLPFPVSVMPRSSTYTAARSPGSPADTLPWRGADVLKDLTCYRVECAGDRVAPPSDEEFQRIASGKDPAERAERYRRYRAVGEFIAVHSDLLIALDNELDEGDQPDPDILADLGRCGTEVIVQAKRLGPTHGVLPIPPALDWSDNGPVFHIHARQATDKASSGRADREVGSLAVLFPYDCAKRIGVEDSEEHDEEDDHDHGRESDRDRAAREGWRLLRAFVRSLEHVNGLKPKPGDGATKSILPTVRPRRFRGPLQAEVAPTAGDWGVASAPEVSSGDARFRRFLAFRERIRQFTDPTDRFVKRLRRHLLILGLFVVALLEVAEEWKTVPADVHGGVAAQTTAHPQGLEGLRSIAAFAAITLLFWALWSLRRHQAKLWAWVAWLARQVRIKVPDASAFERMEDSRAVAEGLRIQFAWSVAGVGESVSANYLQRARGDLQWIRAAISSHAFPYEIDRDAFLRLSRPDQRARLRSVLWGWVHEQRSYFAKRAEEFTRWKIRAHSLASALATAGLVGVFWPLIEHLAHWPGVITWLSPQVGVIIAAGCAMACVSVLAWFNVEVGVWHYWWDRMKKIPDGDPGPHRPPFPLSASRQRQLKRLLHLAHTWWAPTLLGLAFGMGMVAALRSIPAGSWHPSHGPAINIFKGLCFASAGYLHLDAAWRFLTENIHRYVGMHRVYERTGDRMEMLLARMDTADAAGHLDEHDRLRAEVQDLLGTLGRDALDENSDWFVLHRTHPVNPINLH